jgi:hypothetical protein
MSVALSSFNERPAEQNNVIAVGQFQWCAMTGRNRSSSPFAAADLFSGDVFQ